MYYNIDAVDKNIGDYDEEIDYHNDEFKFQLIQLNGYE